MVLIIDRINNLLDQVLKHISESSEKELSIKTSPEKWSKKEILGHLVDSGINNLQRFTEIQFVEKPYQLRTYQQDQLVLANNYQEAELNNIADLLLAINKRIIAIIKLQTEETLDYEIVTSDHKKLDLRTLIIDYVQHFDHHLAQIIG